MANMTLSRPADSTPADNSPARAPRRWCDKFGEALRGVKHGVRGHSSFFVHFFFAALVVAAALVLQCALIEWCALIGCIGAVLTAELFNSALETLFRGLDPATKLRLHGVLDIAAGSFGARFTTATAARS
jgi:diacylglycerol kinase